MGIYRTCQCEYIGNYIYFEKLLVESDIEHFDENKSEIFLGSFARWGALFPDAKPGSRPFFGLARFVF